MGYQESYFKMKESKDFDKLVNAIKEQGKSKFVDAKPVEIITLLKPIDINLGEMCHPEINLHFDKGEKFVYVIGERFHQQNPNNFFRECKNLDNKIKEDLEIYFTECFPSYDIFKNNHKTNMAKHELFEFTK